MQSRITARRKDFKQAFDDPLRRREDAVIQIRKQQREEHLAKKRNQATGDDDTLGGGPGLNMDGPARWGGPGAMTNGTNVSPGEGVRPVDCTRPTDQPSIQSLPNFVQALCSDDPTAQYFGAHQIRRLLSVETDPPIQAVVEANVVSRFVELLQVPDSYNLQFECAWALTNIASGSQQQTAAVLEAGAVEVLVQLIDSPRSDVKEQVIWALGNIAGDSAAFRNAVLEAGALEPILRELRQIGGPDVSVYLLRYGTWTLSNLCRGKPEPPFESVKDALPVLRLLLNISDQETLTDACWAIGYLSDASSTNESQAKYIIQEVIKSGVCPRLIELLGHSSSLVQIPALRAVGNIVTGDDSQTQTMIQYGCLPRLKLLLSSPKKNLKKEACWAISNITAGNRIQIEEVICAGIIPELARLLNNAEFEVKREAAWAIANAATGGNVRQVAHLVEANCLPPLVGLLDVRDPRTVPMTLEAIKNILQTGESRRVQDHLEENPYVRELDAAGGFVRLERLQCVNMDSKVRATVASLLGKYLPSQSEDARGTVIPPSSFGGMA